MARKKIRRLLSGGAIVLFIVLFCVLDISVQAFEVTTIQYTISGSAGISGVTMKGLPGPTVVTDQNGYYSAIVDYAWKGTVTPVLEGYEFTPASKIYSKVTGDMSNEDYTPTEITYTISGKLGMEGVEMNGLPDNPITGSDGTYSATVPHGWQSPVTPIKEGYEFKPSNRGYAPVKSNQTNHDYKPEPMMLLIAGSVGVEGVVMEGLPGNIVSTQGGNYSVKVKYGWEGTVTPKKEGYEFNPAYTDYSNVTETQSSQDYLAEALTYVISGTAGMQGVQMKGLPGDPTTDENGYYSATVEYGFSKTVEPTLGGYTFTPASTIYTKVNSDRLNENYSAATITITISGTTRMEGVVMNGLPENPITGKDGSYSVTVDYGWSDTVTPMIEGYTFTPETKPYVAVTKDMTNQNYTAKRITYTISGSTMVQGVTIKGFPGRAVVSDPSGNYSATVNYGWNGTITPTKVGYDFDPSNIQFDNIVGEQTNQGFTPTIQKRTISGKILSQKGQPIADVYIIADSSGSATTSADGEYEVLVDHGWRGKIMPTRDGYTFSPTSKQYSIVTSDQKQNFTGIVRTFTITDTLKPPIPGITITASNAEGTVDTTTTDAKGKFGVKVPYGWTGEIIPTKEGLRFNPPSQTYTNITSDMMSGDPVLMRTTPAPTTPTPTIPTPTTPMPTTPTPTTPTPTIPTPTTPIPTTPTSPTEAEAPKTALEQDIETMRKQLAQLLDQRSGPGQAPTTSARGDIPVGSGGPLISNTFVDNDLVTEVLPVIATQAGISIIPDETVTGMITADLQDMPLDTALDIVLAGTSYVVKKTPYYYLVCSGSIKDNPMFPIVSETRRLRMNYISSEAAVGLLATPFREYAQAEIGPTTGADTYTVVVTAPPALMNRIVADLKQIDQPLSQILLEARVVVMEKGDLLNLGVEWGWPKIQAGTFKSSHMGQGDPDTDFSSEGPWSIQMGYTPDALFTNALELTLNLLAQNGEATILTKPQVMAQDGKESKIEVSTEEYYMLTSPDLAGSFYTRTELQEIKSGTILTITPHLGDNNDITLQVAVEVSDSIPRGAGSDLPVVTRRKAENNVTIKDGGTVALAGLTENRTRKDIRRVPGLSSIPLIGSLFKSSNNQNSTREIAVFVTARLVSRTGQTVEFTQPSDMPTPIRPAGNDFKARLRESLLR